MRKKADGRQGNSALPLQLKREGGKSDMAAKGIKGKEILLKVGKAIQFWRKLEGYDQFGFSQELGTVRSYVARLESGHTGISLTRVNRIAEILGISIHSILCGLPEKKKRRTSCPFTKTKRLAFPKQNWKSFFAHTLVKDGSRGISICMYCLA